MNAYALDTLHAASAEVPKFLGITNCYLKEEHKAETFLIKPLLIDNKFWIVISNDILPKKGNLIIQTIADIFTLNVFAEPYYFEKDNIQYFKLVFLSHLPEELEQKIKEYVSIREFDEKRCSERFDIGLKNWEGFCLEKATQTLYGSKKKQIKCILSNVSLHGALLTGEIAPFRAGEDILKLRCSFIHPIENIFLNATIIRIEKKDPKLARYSLRFIEPIPLAWQQRVHSFIQGLN